MIRLLFALFCLLNIAFAVREPRPTPIDARIKVMTYNADDVFKFTGYYGYQTTIELSRNEEILSISMGDTTGWQIVPEGYRLFVKPVSQDATTNMTMITNKRTYFFELHAQEVQDISDPQVVFNVRFLYPDEDLDEFTKTYSSSSKGANGPDLAHPEEYNFAYTVSGDDDIIPIRVFDDGEFMYLQFQERNADLPSVFSVDDKLRESLINYRISSDNIKMVVIEHVYPKLSIRYKDKVACVFNESYGRHKLHVDNLSVIESLGN
ncbi:Type IV secretion system protein VirB9 [Rickettsiales endosymbiont of Paramecium tredecaurelia]|uniref:P-type conjugative transfer protein VirB9 n=1 Tax=Candidatus Sarmatiella mevalonica TaxID=2770581 RepID=UPI0019207359|nr:P-type conjugative transfer protein VirB9 [Candidatus Sarmatiella mevalonica]MBL3284231.1 Type IV secretion system protein VirB9 [Candidatus Sarmatiella mevalonica]